MPKISLTSRKCFVMVCLLVACLQSTTGVAQDFDVNAGADAQQQSRQFDIDDPHVLLRACLAVIQDIKFHVTESELEPGLLVADSRPRGLHMLTVSLLQLPNNDQGYRVRLSMSAGSASRKIGEAQTLAYSNFYQNFFNHLQRELFYEGQVQ